MPDMYSQELSLFVQAGIRLLETVKPLIMYLLLTDYIQHKYAPGEPDDDLTIWMTVSGG
jgi:phosphonoacetate hydrolase